MSHDEERFIRFERSLVENIREHLRSDNPEGITQKMFLAKTGLSQATLYKWYSESRANPTLHTLLAISETLDVRLDNLVRPKAEQQMRVPIDYGPFQRYIQNELSEMQRSQNTRVALLERLAHEIILRLDEVVDPISKEVTLDRTLLESATMVEIERYCDKIYVAAETMEFRPRKEGSDWVAGRFFTTMARNMARNAQYRFMLMGDTNAPGFEELQQEAKEIISNLGDLAGQVGKEELASTNRMRVRFIHPDHFPFYGCAFHRIDQDEFLKRRHGKNLFKRIEDFLATDEEGRLWMGQIVPSAQQYHFIMIMRREHVMERKRKFEALWEREDVSPTEV